MRCLLSSLEFYSEQYENNLVFQGPLAGTIDILVEITALEGKRCVVEWIKTGLTYRDCKAVLVSRFKEKG